jgi:23S rRNA (uracil1939-C5)-methyltransferase
VRTCIHFGTCGGCAYQDMPPDAYRAMKRELVATALERAGLADAVVEEAVEIPPFTRRRAVFKAEKRGGETRVGFHAARSHDVVDMRECFVVTPQIFALVGHLREMMGDLLRDGEEIGIDVTQSLSGFDVALVGFRVNDSATRARLAQWASKLKLARLGTAKEIVIDLVAPAMRFGNAEVKLPRGAFLQPTREGEAALQERVVAGVGKAKRVADLFSGCGTFSLVLAQKARVHALERDGAMLEALAAGARMTQGLKPVTTEKRDLFKQPLTPPELKGFDAVVLDPPRSGAQAQAWELTRGKVRRVVYVSCDPVTFARDARILVDGGYTMSPVTPVDQFLWSSHIELVASFQAKGS